MTDTSPVLPEPGKRNVLITSALPYVNNVPHLGNIIGSVLSADVFARYCRGRGIPTVHIGGTDEYGTTTEVRALQENCTPRELCDKYHKMHAEVYEWFSISFDIFGRTSTDLQTEITQGIFTKLNEHGFLQERSITQLYCEAHHSFLADRFVEGECPLCGYPDARGNQCDACGRLLDSLDLKHPRCKLDGSTPLTKATKHIFLSLDKLQPDLASWFLSASSQGAWSPNSKSITSAWLKEGLQPRSITRDIHWGTPIPLPDYSDKVIYSWFDACIGYISITAHYTPQHWQDWWHNPSDVQLYQFIGKDNVVFHSAIFPASLIGTRERWTKVNHLSTTDYLTYEGEKFSKSRGVGVFGDDAAKTGVPADVWRFYLLLHRPETGDAEFTWESFVSCNNQLLLNNVGNFVNRVLKFVDSRFYDGLVPDYTAYHEEAFDAWKEDINDLLEQYIADLDAVRLRAGASIVLRTSQQGNGFLQANRLDGTLYEKEPDKCAAVVGLAVNLVHLLACLMTPYMPDTAESIRTQLRVDAVPIPDYWEADTVKVGHRIGTPAYLFRRIHPDKAREWREMFGGAGGKEQRP